GNVLGPSREEVLRVFVFPRPNSPRTLFFGLKHCLPAWNIVSGLPQAAPAGDAVPPGDRHGARVADRRGEGPGHPAGDRAGAVPGPRPSAAAGGEAGPDPAPPGGVSS